MHMGASNTCTTPSHNFVHSILFRNTSTRKLRHLYPCSNKKAPRFRQDHNNHIFVLPNNVQLSVWSRKWVLQNLSWHVEQVLISQPQAARISVQYRMLHRLLNGTLFGSKTALHSEVLHRYCLLPFTKASLVWLSKKDLCSWNAAVSIGSWL
jgi:hypothetical protein